MLSPSELARFLSELDTHVRDNLDAVFRRDPVHCAVLRHYLFVSQSLNQLEDQVEQHRAEQHFIFDRLIAAGLLEPQIEPYIHAFRQQRMQRYYSHSDARPISTRTPSPIVSSNSSSDIVTPHHRRSLNGSLSSYHTTDEELGSRGNPIYVFDDHEIRCEGCWDEGHFIGNCKREYRLDGRRYVPVPERENLMDHYRHDVQDFKQKAESPQHSKTST
jgi:hypothetical protein